MRDTIKQCAQQSRMWRWTALHGWFSESLISKFEGLLKVKAVRCSGVLVFQCSRMEKDGLSGIAVRLRGNGWTLNSLGARVAYLVGLVRSRSATVSWNHSRTATGNQSTELTPSRDQAHSRLEMNTNPHTFAPGWRAKIKDWRGSWPFTRLLLRLIAMIFFDDCKRSSREKMTARIIQICLPQSSSNYLCGSQRFQLLITGFTLRRSVWRSSCVRGTFSDFALAHRESDATVAVKTDLIDGGWIDPFSSANKRPGGSAMCVYRRGNETWTLIVDSDHPIGHNDVKVYFKVGEGNGHT